MQLTDKDTPRDLPSVHLGLMLYLGYLAIFFSTWVVNGVDYNRIGESAETLRLWYAAPTLFGSLFLCAALSYLGWWRLVLFDRTTAGPKWIWILPLAMAAVIANNFWGIPTAKLTAELLLWSVLGAVGVGFGEEMITRGGMVVALRRRFSEGPVWLISTLMFSALHIPNVLFGVPLWAMPVQVVLTFVMGSALYAVRRMTGTLIAPMLLHGLWDSSLLLHVATGAETSHIQFIVYPLTVVCVIALLRTTWHQRLRNT